MEEYFIYVSILFKNLNQDCDYDEIINKICYASNITDFINHIIKFNNIENYNLIDFEFGKQLDYNNNRILIMDLNNYNKYIQSKAEDIF